MRLLRGLVQDRLSERFERRLVEVTIQTLCCVLVDFHYILLDNRLGDELGGAHRSSPAYNQVLFAFLCDHDLGLGRLLWL